MQYCRSDSVHPTKCLNNSTLDCYFFISSVPIDILSEPYKKTGKILFYENLGFIWYDVFNYS
jgi:hypothetical protein